MTECALAFWGKTPHGEATGSTAKPVLHHLIDVAAAALRLQESSPSRLAREAAVIGVPAGRLLATSAWLAGLHDLGKFSVSFQAKVEALWPAAILGAYPGPQSDRGHWRNTAIILRAKVPEQALRALFPELEDGLEVIAASIAGHHGRPPTHDEYFFNRNRFAFEREVTEPCLEAAVEAMRVLRDLVQPASLPEITEAEQAQVISWRLAGLTTVADWVGSDSEFFTFADPKMLPGDYWHYALSQADKAITAKGLLPSAVRGGIGLATLVPGIDPRPMQAVANAVRLPEGPVLFIIEDTTGSGKTEAALAIAARLMAAGKAEGLYFALPTMATANAMYGRLGDIRPRLFADGARPSLVLAHGRASLSRDLLKSIANARNGTRDEDDDNAAWCAEWIADNRRKAFFADIGAGTIDQAFLAVLKKKHLTLRQFGLAGRVLIVDEAHAFDAYMGKELERLLTVHAALGGSAIVLSATLPADMRRAIVDGFREGLGDSGEVTIHSDAYPLLTSVGRHGVCEQPIEFCDPLRRTVAVERLADAEAAHSAALAAAREGAAVLVIRNAVDEAIASFKTLRALHDETGLFHARFAMCDRQRIEQDALRRFGRDAGSGDRAGRILVATQVVEQSLDLDFDLVVSDLAPIDLLIQRAGRLWRHMDCRPEEGRAISGPRLAVIAPDPSDATHVNWLKPALGRGAFVYKNPGVMWRTATTLFAAGAIRTPCDLRPFIERVYGHDDVPECLEVEQNEAMGGVYADRQLANTNLIDFPAGYPAMDEISADQEIGTRLGEKTVTLRLARREGERLIPWARNSIDELQSSVEDRVGETQLWALSEVSVRRKWLGDARPPPTLDGPLRAARASWPDWDQTMIAVVEEDGPIAFDAADSEFSYSTETGLTKQATAN